MPIDLYTKVVLTVIAIGVGMLVFQQKPITEAQADFGGGNEMITPTTAGGGPGEGFALGHLRNGQVRFCRPLAVAELTFCTAWSN